MRSKNQWLSRLFLRGCRSVLPRDLLRTLLWHALRRVRECLDGLWRSDSARNRTEQVLLFRLQQATTSACALSPLGYRCGMRGRTRAAFQVQYAFFSGLRMEALASRCLRRSRKVRGSKSRSTPPRLQETSISFWRQETRARVEAESVEEA
ncbi:hypothetical protein IE81DRAFT_100136 [Ceraceosorus guamensis]|uniref:Uncharacterized protein n=1 Tax=Ceraceosorus guamensis TaxID=1522189 RepID=A0A316W6C4_9BASI|nr:hypothetical protein IE81DRAFT_100136 [Ceraceosorus guamensis]PWN43215.1 hypothetical protein IE81DRAFT_100136 [Ceraceosorus guamensis]